MQAPSAESLSYFLIQIPPLDLLIKKHSVNFGLKLMLLEIMLVKQIMQLCN